MAKNSTVSESSGNSIGKRKWPSSVLLPYVYKNDQKLFSYVTVKLRRIDQSDEFSSVGIVGTGIQKGIKTSETDIYQRGTSVHPTANRSKNTVKEQENPNECLLTKEEKKERTSSPVSVKSELTENDTLFEASEFKTAIPSVDSEGVAGHQHFVKDLLRKKIQSKRASSSKLQYQKFRLCQFQIQNQQPCFRMVPVKPLLNQTSIIKPTLCVVQLHQQNSSCTADNTTNAVSRQKSEQISNSGQAESSVSKSVNLNGIQGTDSSSSKLEIQSQQPYYRIVPMKPVLNQTSVPKSAISLLCKQNINSSCSVDSATHDLSIKSDQIEGIDQDVSSVKPVNLHKTQGTDSGASTKPKIQSQQPCYRILSKNQTHVFQPMISLLPQQNINSSSLIDRTTKDLSRQKSERISESSSIAVSVNLHEIQDTDKVMSTEMNIVTATTTTPSEYVNIESRILSATESIRTQYLRNDSLSTPSCEQTHVNPSSDLQQCTNTKQMTTFGYSRDKGYRMTMQCWLCPRIFASRQELKNHVVGSAHSRLKVICPWCFDYEKVNSRVGDLKKHVNLKHPGVIGTLSSTYLSEASGFYLSLHPADYSRIISPVPENSPDAVSVKNSVRMWHAQVKGPSRTMQEWEQGWAQRSSLRPASLQPSLDTRMTMQCWLCPGIFASRQELKYHVAGPAHSRFKVICPWCIDSENVMNRITDLKRHVSTKHPYLISTLSSTRFSEASGFYLSLHPADYSRLIKPPPANSPDAVSIKNCVRKWYRRVKGPSRTMQNWECGWAQGGSSDNGSIPPVEHKSESSHELMKCESCSLVKCKFCGHTYRSSICLRDHEGMHTERAPEYCGEESSRNLNREQKGEITCGQCGKEFPLGTDLTEHTKMHTKDTLLDRPQDRESAINETVQGDGPGQNVNRVGPSDFPLFPVSHGQPDMKDFSKEFSEFMETSGTEISMSMEECLPLEHSTRKSSHQDEGIVKDIISKRLVASKFGDVLKLCRTLRTEPVQIESEDIQICLSEEYVDDLFDLECPEDMCFIQTVKSKAIEWYLEHKKYIDFEWVCVDDCGVVINPAFPQFVAKPDGKVAIKVKGKDDLIGVLMVYCPEIQSGSSFREASKSKDFCLAPRCLRSVKLTINKSHNFYYEIQGTLAITGLEWCDIVVYTDQETHVERVPFDEDIWKEYMFPQLTKFYVDHALSHFKLTSEHLK